MRGELAPRHTSLIAVARACRRLAARFGFAALGTSRSLVVAVEGALELIVGLLLGASFAAPHQLVCHPIHRSLLWATIQSFC